MPAITNVIGFDDAPFAHRHRGNVRIFGAICARTRLDGVVSGPVRRDGANATARMIALVEESQFRRHVRAVLLQGIAVAGFNIVDVHRLAERLEVPVVVAAQAQARADEGGPLRAHAGSGPQMAPRRAGRRNGAARKRVGAARGHRSR